MRHLFVVILIVAEALSYHCSMVVNKLLSDSISSLIHFLNEDHISIILKKLVLIVHNYLIWDWIQYLCFELSICCFFFIFTFKSPLILYPIFLMLNVGISLKPWHDVGLNITKFYETMKVISDICCFLWTSFCFLHFMYSSGVLGTSQT